MSREEGKKSKFTNSDLASVQDYYQEKEESQKKDSETIETRKQDPSKKNLKAFFENKANAVKDKEAQYQEDLAKTQQYKHKAIPTPKHNETLRQQDVALASGEVDSTSPQGSVKERAARMQSLLNAGRPTRVQQQLHQGTKPATQYGTREASTPQPQKRPIPLLAPENDSPEHEIYAQADGFISPLLDQADRVKHSRTTATPPIDSQLAEFYALFRQMQDLAHQLGENLEENKKILAKLNALLDIFDKKDAPPALQARTENIRQATRSSTPEEVQISVRGFGEELGTLQKGVPPTSGPAVPQIPVAYWNRYGHTALDHSGTEDREATRQHISSTTHTRTQGNFQDDLSPLDRLIKHIKEHPEAQNYRSTKELTVAKDQRWNSSLNTSQMVADTATQIPLRDLGFSKMQEADGRTVYNVDLPAQNYTGPIFMPRLDKNGVQVSMSDGKPSYDILFYQDGKVDPSRSFIAPEGTPPSQGIPTIKNEDRAKILAHNQSRLPNHAVLAAGKALQSQVVEASGSNIPPHRGPQDPKRIRQ